MRLFSVSVALLLAWGALAFGAEFSWAYTPLLVFGLVPTALGLIAAGAMSPATRNIEVALVAVFLASLLQLVPTAQFGAGVVAGDVRAASTELYAKATMRESNSGSRDRSERNRGTSSIQPARTVLGLAFLGGLALVFAGCGRGMSVIGPLGISRCILVLGLLVAVVGIVQRASMSDAFYGVLYPRQLTGPNAPFANRNHFAGWMVMALSVSAGLFAAGIARGMRGLRPGWRNRVLWFSSREANETLLTGLALSVMAVSIILTVSRSGLVCLVATILMASWWVARRQSSRGRKIVAAGYLAFVLLIAASWGNIDAVIRRFEGAGIDFGGRLAIWQDTIRIIKDFWLTGTGLNTYKTLPIPQCSGSLTTTVAC